MEGCYPQFSQFNMPFVSVISARHDWSDRRLEIEAIFPIIEGSRGDLIFTTPALNKQNAFFC